MQLYVDPYNVWMGVGMIIVFVALVLFFNLRGRGL
jgi:hypothetical protein